MEVSAIQKKLRKFVEERDWDQFHTPKNLAISLVLESSEVLEKFQWKKDEGLTAVEKEEITEEIADVFIYLLLLSNKLGIDLLAETQKKILINGKKYPVEKAKGRATKYNKL